MKEEVIRSTIYFDPRIHRALRIKAESTNRSVSNLVNEAVQLALQEDREDLAAFDDRLGELTVSYKAFLNDLKRRGKL